MQRENNTFNYEIPIKHLSSGTANCMSMSSHFMPGLHLALTVTLSLSLDCPFDWRSLNIN